MPLNTLTIGKQTFTSARDRHTHTHTEPIRVLWGIYFSLICSI